MKFRTLGVALLVGSGLALAATSMSPAVAQTPPYPANECSGPFGAGTVDPPTVGIGDPTTFAGCGFAPFTDVAIAVDEENVGTATADEDGNFSFILTFDTLGEFTLTGIGQGLGLDLDGALADDEATVESTLATEAGAVPAQSTYPLRTVIATVEVVEEVEPRDDEPKDEEPKDEEPTDDPKGEDPEGDEPRGDEGKDGWGGHGDWDGKHRWGNDSGSWGEGEGEGDAADPADPAEQSGGLPFTGIETGALAAIAVGLVGGGVLLRVAARRRVTGARR